MTKKSTVAFSILMALLLLAVPAFAQDETPTGVVTGRIINLTPDGTVPEKMDMMLHAWDKNFDEKLMLAGYSKADGTFEFTDVLLDSGLLYVVMLAYNDVAYASEPIGVTPGQSELSLQLPIYESTTDSSSVRIERQHILFDATPNGLRVAEVYILSNTGSRTIIGQVKEEDARLSSLQFPLPEGATNISFNEGGGNERFMLAPGGFVDTAPLRPGKGTGQVVVTYVLPYEDSLTYSWTAQWPVESVSFMLTTGTGLRLEGENLKPEGTRDFGAGGQVDVFSHGALKPGESVTVSLSGALWRPIVAPTGELAPESKNGIGSSLKRGLALGGAALGLALMAAGIWWYRRPEPEETGEEQAGPDADYYHLVTQIALLDEAWDRGEVEPAEYDWRREQLIREAKALLAKPSEQDAVSLLPSE